MADPLNLQIGTRFGDWTIIGPAAPNKYGHRHWQCRCDCGTERRVPQGRMMAGQSLSCGCLTRRVTSHVKFKHGMFGTTEYRIWAGMIQRCTNPKVKGFPNYGGRGITVCDRWRQFENFYADMGARPSADHSIDRIDNGGNYEPGNCRWATASEQAFNRRPKRREREAAAAP